MKQADSIDFEAIKRASLSPSDWIVWVSQQPEILGFSANQNAKSNLKKSQAALGALQWAKRPAWPIFGTATAASFFNPLEALFLPLLLFLSPFHPPFSLSHTHTPSFSLPSFFAILGSHLCVLCCSR